MRHTLSLAVVSGLLALPATALPRGIPSWGLTPLNDLGAGSYSTFTGGLYPGGSNVRPATHTADGLLQAAQVVPRDAAGAPDSTGKILFVSIGMSNTFLEWAELMTLTSTDPVRDPRVQLVQCAQPGMSAAVIADPLSTYWGYVTSQVAVAGATDLQVQAAWLKEAHASPTDPFPTEALALQSDLTTILQILHTKFPNLRIVYLSSRIYAGYATIPTSPEPYAYESGFAVKWTIESQISGAALAFSGATPVSPWISWGPYTWADGVVPRSDGLTWTSGEYIGDGTHPNTAGAVKIAHMLLDLVHLDPTAYWYRLPAVPVSTSSPFCSGDSLDADVSISCPCQNYGTLGHGCANSFDPRGAALTSGGTPDPDQVRFAGSGMPATSFGLYLQHSTLEQAVFHDGVRCGGGTLIRLRGRAAVNGASLFPDSTDTVTVSQRGQVTPGSGAQRYYSLFYRNASTSFCPPATANVTNGWKITW